MRRADRAMSEPDARELLQKALHGVLSLAGSAGEGYGVPLSYALVDDCLYLHCAPEGRKLEALRARPLASFCVVGAVETLPEKFSTRYESVIVSGEVEELSGEEKLTALRALVAKYSADYQAEGEKYIAAAAAKTCALHMKIRELSGKRRS